MKRALSNSLLSLPRGSKISARSCRSCTSGRMCEIGQPRRFANINSSIVRRAVAAEKQDKSVRVRIFSSFPPRLRGAAVLIHGQRLLTLHIAEDEHLNHCGVPRGAVTEVMLARAPVAI